MARTGADLCVLNLQPHRTGGGGGGLGGGVAHSQPVPDSDGRTAAQPDVATVGGDAPAIDGDGARPVGSGQETGAQHQVQTARAGADAGRRQGDAVGNVIARPQAERGIAPGSFGQCDAAAPGDVAHHVVEHAGAGVEGGGVAVGHCLRDGGVRRVQIPKATLTAVANIGPGVDAGPLDMERVARGFDPPAVAAFRAAAGREAARHGGDGARARGIAPEHHGAALALHSGTGVDAGVSSQRDSAGLRQRLRPDTAVGMGAALPVTPHQHLAAPGGAAGVDAGVVQEFNVIAQQDVDTALAAAPSRAQRAVAHDRQAALTRRIGQGLGMARLQGRCCAKLDLPAFGTTGVQCGVVHYEIATGAHLDLAALADSGGFSHRGCGLGRDIHLALQINLAGRLHHEGPALHRCGEINTAAVGLGELRGLNVHRACTAHRFFDELGCRCCGADGAAVDHLGRTDFHLACRTALGTGAARCCVGTDGAAVVHLATGRQDDAPGLHLQAMGFNFSAVLDHATDQPVHRLGADDDQPTRGLHGMAVVHQSRNLAGLHPDAG